MPTKSKPKPVRRLSKSKFVLGMQCQKALYLTVHSPEEADEVSASQQMIFDQGHLVGVEAHKQFPGGVLIDAPYDQSDLAMKQTQDAIKAGALAIFEATFQHEGVLVKIDVLHRKSVKSAWQIKEVKSSTKVKDVHLQDAAIQLWVARANLPKVETISIMFINNQCVHPKLKDLFSSEDITEQAEELLPKIPKLVKQFHTVLAEENAPEQSIGLHCSNPYSCAFQETCWSKKVPSPSVFNLPGIHQKKAWDYFNKGKVSLKKLDPEDFNDLQIRVIEASISEKRFLDPKGISNELKSWEYPLSFLDFETISPAVPQFPGTRPYQKLAFQFSCHVKKTPKAKLEHFEFLHDKNSDPRENIARALVELVPGEGSVVAYNKGFEGSVLRSLADEFPKYSKKLLSIEERLVDPLPVIKAHVYDPAFLGSFSIKAVAPALLGAMASYKDLEVADGGEAQAAYLQLVSLPTKSEEKAKLRAHLIEYCTKDTLGMVQLVEWLYSQSKK